MKRGLGKGLASLIAEEGETKEQNTQEISISKISPNSEQPRKVFNSGTLQELAASIKQKGVLQPIIVNKIDNERYKIIAGERRYIAAKLAGLNSIPVIVKELDDKNIAEISIIENVQREDLNVIEEARAYQKLIKQFDYSQQEIADKVSKSRSHVTNLLRLTSLEEKVQQMLQHGELSMGHARCLVGIDNAVEIANEIVSKQLSVRQTEQLIAKINKKPSKVKKSDNISDNVKLNIEQLGKHLHTSVTINAKKKGGVMNINYQSEEHLKEIIEKIYYD